MNNTESMDEKFFNSFSTLAKEEIPFFANIFQRSHNEFGSPWVHEFVSMVTTLLGNDKANLVSALHGYAEFALEAAKDQKDFEKNEKYKLSSFDHVNQEYYNNPIYMQKSYLPGLFLSNYLWPHHYRLLKFFQSKVLPRIKQPSSFYDVGIGTGLYSKQTLIFFPEIKGTGFDISKHSLEFTTRLLSAYGINNRYRIELKNIIEMEQNLPQSDFIICHELLEHLEDPKKLCEILFRMISKDGLAFITAALNAAHPDHIYLFRNPEEVLHILKACGWKILNYCHEIAYPGKPTNITPSVVGFLCQREAQ